MKNKTRYYLMKIKRYTKIVVALPFVLLIMVVGFIFIGMEAIGEWGSDKVADSIDDGILNSIAKWVNKQ